MNKIFSVFGSLLLSVCMGLAIALYYGIGDFFLLAMITLMSAFVVAKMMMCFHFMRGQAYFALENPAGTNMMNKFCLAVFKMRFGQVLIMSVITTIVLALMYTSFFIDAGDASVLGDRTISNLRAFSLSAFIGLAIAFAHWAILWRDYFYGSEYDARIEFKVKGYGEDEVEQKIKALRAMGVFGPTLAT